MQGIPQPTYVHGLTFKKLSAGTQNHELTVNIPMVIVRSSPFLAIPIVIKRLQSRGALPEVDRSHPSGSLLLDLIEIPIAFPHN
jgi:hypothetical protein